MEVAPYQSCIGCFAGDTRTLVHLRGEAEFVIAATHVLAGLSMDEASATFEVYAREQFGCAPGKVPAGSLDHAFRLCRVCARRTGAIVSDEGSAGSVYIERRQAQ